MNLRDALLQGLANLPGTREFHIHVLVSSPRKHSNLYPYAAPRPKAYLQQILVLLSEQPTADSPRVFVSAIEAFLYHIPSASSAVLYVSKVDSTGQAKAPSPTPALVRALLTYYVDPSTRPVSVAHLWVHLFARAQNQYLFPNSGEYPGKRPLTDVKLCAWWKRQLSMVAEEVSARAVSGGDHVVPRIRLFYLLPGLGEVEASHALDRVYGATSTATWAGSVPWSYGHPYGEREVPLPCVPIGCDEKAGHIGYVIPWFDDDPKARFLDEIAYTTEAEGIKSPERKRARTHRTSLKGEEEGESGRETCGGAKSEETSKALRKVSVEEFWERMSFRQECIAGAVTGFFVMGTSCPTPTGSGSRSEPPGLAAVPGQVSPQMMKRVVSSLMTGHEFPTVERAVWSTRVLEEVIKGLCDGLKMEGAQSPGDEPLRGTPERDTGGSLGLPETPPRLTKRAMEDDSPKGFAEGNASLETYESYIYGAVEVRNAEMARREGGSGEGKRTVTVLTARRKKRGKE